MKRYIITYLLLISTLCVLAQKQANTWYFGNRVGLDFNYSPPLALNNGEANSFEGTASISDNNGKLLFYTNGNTVQNRRHDAMPNGIGLRGDISSTDNAVIVPMPGNDSMYYIFTIGSAMEEEPVFCYSIVDMKADGGYGDVIVKNILIKDSVLEKMAAIRHCNKRDTWIVIQHWKTDEYYAYLLTPSGLNSPVISSTGFILSGTVLNSIGTLKFSSKGNKLAACHAFDNDAVQLMDFDNTTGVISTPWFFIQMPYLTRIHIPVYMAPSFRPMAGCYTYLQTIQLLIPARSTSLISLQIMQPLYWHQNKLLHKLHPGLPVTCNWLLIKKYILPCGRIHQFL
ncbi:MAG: hypothetical protein IPI54_05730 [Chitinophagaceae bacterium]|nr:hypothetical protein [Chitinophagaceae bacterium]